MGTVKMEVIGFIPVLAQICKSGLIRLTSPDHRDVSALLNLRNVSGASLDKRPPETHHRVEIP